MKKSAFTEEHLTLALTKAERGRAGTEVSHEIGISEQTFCRRKKKYAGLGVAEFRRLRQLEEENRQLKQLVAGLSLDKHMLSAVG